VNDILNWLYSQRRYSKKIGLERTRALLQEMGNPQDSFKAILIGGTNGKGSTASNLASIFKEAGIKAGFFSSPHLSYFSERFLIDGKRLKSREIKEALLKIKPKAIKTEATFFEIATALACQLFKDNKVEYAIMEVGIGGVNDATNVLEPIQSAITAISVEHSAVLGKTLAEIAEKKAGIMRKDISSFVSTQGQALQTLKRVAKEKGAKLVLLDDYQIKEISKDWQSSKFILANKQFALELQTPLLGNYQLRNASLAALLAKNLKISDQAIKSGISKAVWPARLERIRYKERVFVLDGAHNPGAIKALIESLKELKTTKMLLIFGVMQTKDVENMLEPLSEIAKEFIFTQADSFRSTPAKELKKLCSLKSGYRSKPKDAIELAVKRTKKNEKILVVGSLYLMGEIRPLLLS